MACKTKQHLYLLIWPYLLLVAIGCTTTGDKAPPPKSHQSPPTCAINDAGKDYQQSRQEFCACQTDGSVCSPAGALTAWEKRISEALSSFRPLSQGQKTCSQQLLDTRAEEFNFALATSCAKTGNFKEKRSLLAPPPVSPSDCRFVDYIDEGGCLIIRNCGDAPASQTQRICPRGLSIIHQAKLQPLGDGKPTSINPWQLYTSISTANVPPCIHATKLCDPESFWLPQTSAQAPASHVVKAASASKLLPKQGLPLLKKTATYEDLVEGCILQRSLDVQLVVYANYGFCYLYKLNGPGAPPQLRMLPCPQAFAEFGKHYCPLSPKPTSSKSS